MSFIFTTNLNLKRPELNINQIETFITEAIHSLGVKVNYSTFNGQFKISIPKKVPAEVYFDNLAKYLNCNIFYN